LLRDTGVIDALRRDAAVALVAMRPRRQCLAVPARAERFRGGGGGDRSRLRRLGGRRRGESCTKPGRTAG